MHETVAHEEWKDMEQIWAQSNPGGPDVNAILRYVAERAERFDRSVRWRNARELLGGLLGLACLVPFLMGIDNVIKLAFGVSMAILLVGVCGYLTIKGRSGPPIDPSTSLPEYRAALERKFERQIRTLSRAKYWFLVPVLATSAATLWVYVSGGRVTESFYLFPLVVAGGLVAWWVNDAIAVRKVRRDWEQIRRALDDGELP